MKNFFLVAVILTLFLSGACKMKETADLLVLYSKVYTADDQFRTAEAFAVKEGKILAVGSTQDIRMNYYSENILDGTGKFIYPGFIDAHCHFNGYGASLMMVDLVGTTSFEDVLSRLKSQSRIQELEWIRGRGWDQNDWPVKEFPDRRELDKLFPDKPVMLTRVDGHAALVNQKALEIAGINLNTKIKSGEFIKKDGRLTGILIDGAIGLVSSKIPKPDKNEIERSLLAAQENCLSVGLTSVQDAGLDKKTIEIINELGIKGKLKMRVYAMLSPSKENFETYMFKGKFKNEHLHIRSIKLFADGALGSRGAWLIEPYSDDPGNSGIFTSTTEYLNTICALADSCGYQVNTHCIGDAANREILKIYSSILKDKNDKRWRIEHAQVIAKEDFDLFGKYNIIPSIQSTHATSDMYWAGDRLGKDRVVNAYAFKKLLDQNGWLPNGSDFPVENINPLFGFFAAVSRKDQKLYPPEGFQPENALSREETLKAMTIWAARAAFEEDEKGSIEPGKLADFVICDGDIMTVNEEMIFKVNVEQTYISGEKVFSK